MGLGLRRRAMYGRRRARGEVRGREDGRKKGVGRRKEISDTDMRYEWKEMDTGQSLNDIRDRIWVGYRFFTGDVT